ncbi:MAG: hypothetical protein UY31_C0017G0002 [Candidatus Wolfebacteria bacterium GW2011_GWE1_48_7]|uniref:tRNA threonylcarbamoyladenosine biosynthesis protein TsaE n=2 Tax=Candidatus Wolfeibacteriota TaxID=1752735 RepID=A0A0G1U3R4_9BACT|nr:MAG: hypothetical protein UX70_C0001G0214 [Candidatus Wolfebacteria bacterium GW2011_GWB1_47_1]KKU36824.1 MAG: hypothetical protein UX49_C0008G0017 [Candidatus Wolfebacteria bacterium GW2011_GWC2_46_275]KKU42014.1 MAG: hypothetical protein UX58_C0004G0073 [Candidatus Wolfebacteria bacterium GW2011_GWB2_46_69]KKU54450.1 MAG: hypothetical protein UX76_C0002G0043 [Candidatus Wolfebacteria bacterium GW2011_GWC1_47_103]KKU59777.1 MAG: hypothetical protein UX83_C0002G0064 [Candidatus Wolfebacteria
MQYKTTSSTETKKIAKLFAEELIKTKPGKKAFVVIFKGDLGAGKTTFIQGLMKELGVKGKVMSPTFTLLRSYSLVSRSKRSIVAGAEFAKVHHFDCYRIGDVSEMKELGFGELLADPQNIILVEWPERITKVLPHEKISVVLSYGETINERTIEVI